MKFEYHIRLRGEGRLCGDCSSSDVTIQPQYCVGIYHGWPNNTVELEAWYQLRQIKWCIHRWWGTYVSYLILLT